jgi:cell division protein ZapA
MADELLINVAIAERKYKVRIQRDEEEIFRKASDVINEKIEGYARLYAYKDKQDLLAMVLLQYVTQYLTVERQRIFNDKELLEQLESLDSTLSAELEKI